jgi:hypothetical protein
MYEQCWAAIRPMAWHDRLGPLPEMSHGAQARRTVCGAPRPVTVHRALAVARPVHAPRRLPGEGTDGESSSKVRASRRVK